MWQLSSYLHLRMDFPFARGRLEERKGTKEIPRIASRTRLVSLPDQKVLCEQQFDSEQEKQISKRNEVGDLVL